MSKQLPRNLTELANEAQHDPAAAAKFLDAVYEVMRDIARKQVGEHGRPGEGATEVTHEVAADFLTPSAPTTYANRQHVFGGLAARIRHKIIDLARHRRRSKRGGGVTHLPIDSPAALSVSAGEGDKLDVMVVRDAFATLQAEHPNAYQTLKLRNEGYSAQEVADRLDVSPKTVVRWTKFGTAFLYGQLSDGSSKTRPG
jgi:DNA-directed RNA polymerase specialized sigma24 family protein